MFLFLSGLTVYIYILQTGVDRVKCLGLRWCAAAVIVFFCVTAGNVSQLFSCYLGDFCSCELTGKVDGFYKDG